MKILYSDIKKLIPGLSANGGSIPCGKTGPKQIGEFLTMAGFMMDGFEKTSYQGKTDYSISLEVRHNRADCLSVIGIANEIAARWGLKVKYPIVRVETGLKPVSTKSQNIQVLDDKYIKRVLAYEIENIHNKKSPRWLTDWLALYDMNSKNLLVDLSNYVMLITGHPSHLLDMNKIHGKLYWDMNKKNESITTLDGTLVKLTKDREIILRDNKNILALAGIVGGKKAELDLDTSAIIAEMAVYDPGTVRKNSSGTKVTTEASLRLGRFLDPNGLDYAMSLLLTLILKHCGSEKTVFRKFNHYPKRYAAPKIKFDPSKPAIYAGIDIPKEKAVEILKGLRFTVKKSGKHNVVTPPTGRMDVTIEEDLIEEVIRIYGFEKIPSSEIPKLEVTKDITPKVVKLAEKTRDILSILGYDEILSSPLTAKKSNKLTNYRTWKLITTQNAVNDEFPDLRQSIGVGLINQLAEYRKKNLAHVQIFEIGKIFGATEKKYEEYESLGILYNHTAKSSALEYLRYILEVTLRYLGLDGINYRSRNTARFIPTKPAIANPYCCYDILVKDKPVGIIYKLKPEAENERSYFAEINLTLISEIVDAFKARPAVELTKKLVTLDANIQLEKEESVYPVLKSFEKNIGRKNLWNIEIVDAFPAGNKIKYTIRVTYQELADPEAKKLHIKVFGLAK